MSRHSADLVSRSESSTQSGGQAATRRPVVLPTFQKVCFTVLLSLELMLWLLGPLLVLDLLSGITETRDIYIKSRRVKPMEYLTNFYRDRDQTEFKNDEGKSKAAPRYNRSLGNRV